MGLGQWIQRGLGMTGGIGVDLHSPRIFDWPDGAIPVEVIVSGHKSEPRTISAFSFQLKDKAPSGGDESRSDGDRFSHAWTHKESIEVAAGSMLKIPLSVALPTPPTADDLGIADSLQAQGFAERMLAKGFMSATRLPQGIHQYRISVAVTVDGVKRPVRDTQGILHGGSSKSTFGIGGFSIS